MTEDTMITDNPLCDCCGDAVRAVLAKWYWQGDPARVRDEQIFSSTYGFTMASEMRTLVRAAIVELNRLLALHDEPPLTLAAADWALPSVDAKVKELIELLCKLLDDRS